MNICWYDKMAYFLLAKVGRQRGDRMNSLSEAGTRRCPLRSVGKVIVEALLEHPILVVVELLDVLKVISQSKLDESATTN